MPKNKGKGGKNRRRGKNEAEEKRELIFKEDGQEYAQVLRMLGNGRLEAQCIDGVKRLCHIRGKMRKKVWVNQGDIVLIGLREFQDGKGDVILKVRRGGRGAPERAVGGATGWVSRSLRVASASARALSGGGGGGAPALELQPPPQNQTTHPSPLHSTNPNNKTVHGR
jgi:initiation factor 1A